MAQSTIGPVRRRSCRVLTPDQRRADYLKDGGDITLGLAEYLLFKRLWKAVMPSIFPKVLPKISFTQITGLKLVLRYFWPMSTDNLVEQRQERRRPSSPPSTQEVVDQLKIKAIVLGVIALMSEAVVQVLKRRR
jgi:hypothetical protein